MSDQRSQPLARRSFLSRFGAGAAAFGTAFGAGAIVEAQSATPASGWQATKHDEDAWFEQVNAKHRFFIDTTLAQALGRAIFYSNNFLTASASGYKLVDADTAIVIGVRHESTPFAFTDAMWAKYGAGLAERSNFMDPKTKAVPTVNVYTTTGYGQQLPNLGVTFDTILKRGVRLSVCQLATRACAQAIAAKTGGNVNELYAELTSNLVPNAHIVPAGIIAVNRAQERGYTFSYVG